MAISTYLSIIILNVRALNAPIKDRGWPIGLKIIIIIRPIYKTLTSEVKIIQTESEGMVKDISCK